MDQPHTFTVVFLALEFFVTDCTPKVFQMYWGVSNVLGCFECIGVFRMYWGVYNKLGCFECIGVFQIDWGVSNRLGCFE